MTFRKIDRLYYQAEAEARVDIMGAFPTIEDMQLYLNHVLSRRWFRENFGEFEVEARYVRRVQVCGTHRARGKFVIDFSLGRMHEGVALHELAHLPTYVPDLSHNDHGPAFAAAHLLILDKMVDDIYCDWFRAALKKRGFVWAELEG